MVTCIEAKVSASWFYVQKHQAIWPHLVAMHEGKSAPDLLGLCERLKAAKQLKACGGTEYLASLQDATPSALNLGYYLDIVREKSELRWQLARVSEIKQKIAEGGTPEQLRELLKESAERISVGLSDRRKRPTLEVVTPKEIGEFKTDSTLLLIGDTDFRKGYEGVTVIGGPPGSGKSLLSLTLAIAGALGNGLWQGRKVHRQFKTLILGAENGRMRWKRDFAELREHYPKLDLDKWVRVALPPEGGLCFHRSEFRQAIKEQVRVFNPDLVVIDPWTSVASEDTSKDVVDKLAEIRSCFPPGDECPCVVIVAHTKKPRNEDLGNRGRALMYSISGSQALVSTARCVYVLLPFTDDIVDNRVLWCCSKLSDGTPPEDGVYLRRLGRPFEATDDDPEDYWHKGERDTGVWLRLEMVKEALTQPRKDGATSVYTLHGLARHLADTHHEGRGVSSVHKWFKSPEFSPHIVKVGSFVEWKD
jgi:hypothetical protein